MMPLASLWCSVGEGGCEDIGVKGVRRGVCGGEAVRNCPYAVKLFVDANDGRGWSTSPSDEDRRGSRSSCDVISMCGSIFPFPFFSPTTDGDDIERFFILESSPLLECTFLNFHRTPNSPLTNGTFESWSICRCIWKSACFGSSCPNCERRPWFWFDAAVDEEELDAEAMEVLFMVMAGSQED